MNTAHENDDKARGHADDTAALRTRLLIVEAALRCIEDETHRALEEPESAIDALCRIAAIARQAAR